MVVGVDRPVESVPQQRAEVVRKAIGIDALALNQTGVAERGLFCRASPVDEHDRAPALLQVQRDADSDDSCTQYYRVAAHQLLETGIQTPILYRFGDVLGGDHVPAAQISNGTGDPEHAVVSTRRKQQTGEGMAQQLIALAIGSAVAVDFPGAEERVRLALSRELQFPCLLHPLLDECRGLAVGRAEQLALARGGYLQLDVDSVGERTGHSPAVARDPLRRASAAAGAIAAMPARTGIHRRDELEARRELRLVRSARDRHAAGLERLA